MADYRLVYTSNIGFVIDEENCHVRLGPLSYISRDFGVDRENRRYSGPMQHKFLEGEYGVHRVRDCVGNLFTAITLQAVDPLRLVDYVAKSARAITADAPAKDLVFDKRRWKRFVASGKTPRRPLVASQPHRILEDDVKKNNNTRSGLINALSIAAGICRVTWENDQVKSKILKVTETEVEEELTVTEDDMLRGDNNTFYVRQLSRPVDGELKTTLSSPEMTEFSLTVGNSGVPSIVGVYHEDGVSDGVSGYVVYTDTDMGGRALYARQAFAVVLAPVCYHQQRMVDTTNCGARFGLTVACDEFAVNKSQERTAPDTTQHTLEADQVVLPKRRKTQKPTRVKRKKRCKIYDFVCPPPLELTTTNTTRTDDNDCSAARLAQPAPKSYATPLFLDGVAAELEVDTELSRLEASEVEIPDSVVEFILSYDGVGERFTLPELESCASAVLDNLLLVEETSPETPFHFTTFC